MSHKNGYNWNNTNGAWIYGPKEGDYLISIELMSGPADKYSVHIRRYDIASLYRRAFSGNPEGLIGDVLTGLTLSEVLTLLKAYNEHNKHKIPIPDDFTRTKTLPLAV